MKDLFNVKGKVALVTGGSAGIGAMIARGLVENGARTYISSRKAANCAEKAEELSQYGECLSIPCDISNMEDIDHLVKKLDEKENKIDILINNAGAAWGDPFDIFPEAGWDKVMNVNAKAVFFLIQRLLPLLRSNADPDDPARVINIASVDGLHVPFFDSFSYGASKAAVIHLTKILAKRLSKENILVNAVAPGSFLTKMVSGSFKEMGEDIILSKIPLGRFGNAEDIVGAIIYLSSRAGAYVTGSVLLVDGGMVGCI